MRRDDEVMTAAYFVKKGILCADFFLLHGRQKSGIRQSRKPIQNY